MKKNIHIQGEHIILLCFLVFGLPSYSFPQSIFSDSVQTIHIFFPQSDFRGSLTKNYPSKTYLKADIVIGNDTINNIGIRYKGNSSYTYFPGIKKPFKIDFNKFSPTSTYQGLKKLNLHNAHLDPTFLREKLVYDWFKQNDIPAPRCSFARLYLNGEDYGLYILVEQIDKDFLKKHFEYDEGDLFKATQSAHLDWQGNTDSLYYLFYELKYSEQENPWPNLVNLINLVNHSLPNEFEDSVELYFQIDHYLKIWAIDNLFANFDSYLHSGNSYYLYLPPQSKSFVWIPWDYNGAFGIALCSFSEEKADLNPLYTPTTSIKPLNQNILSNQNLKINYLSHFKDFLNQGFSPDYLFPRIDELAAMIRPHVYADSIKMFSNSDFETGIYHEQTYLIDNTFNVCIPGLKDFIIQRSIFLDSIINQTDINSYSQDCSQNICLEQNYPNPFWQNTTIIFRVNQGENYHFRIFDLQGNLVMERRGIGMGFSQKIQLKNLDIRPGVYLYILDSENKRLSKKLIKMGT